MTAPELTGAAAGPDQRVGTRFRIGFGVASFGLLTTLLTPLQMLLPLQSADLAPDAAAGTLALVSTAGGVVAVLASPLVGMMSDRTRSRLGRRRPWAFVSGVAGTVGAVWLASAGDVGALVAAFAVLQIGLGGLVATTLALVADQVPVDQRGEVASLVGIAAALGPMSGAWIVSAVDGAAAPAYLVLAALLLGCTAVLVAVTPERSSRSLPVRPWDWREWCAGFWLNPRGRPDLGWAWITRFLVFLGMALSTGFVMFWMRNVLGAASPEAAADGMAGTTTGYAAAMVVAAVAAGIVSDRLRRRKALLAGAAIVLAVTCVANLGWPTWAGLMVTSVVSGLAFGVYSTVDIAIAADILSGAPDRARALGVLQSATTFPSLAGPSLGAVLLTSPGGFPALFAAAAVCMTAAAFTVTRIRSTR